MCGICGIYHQDRQRNVDPWRIEAMKHALAHRGPDDSGELLQWNLGLEHQRPIIFSFVFDFLVF